MSMTFSEHETSPLAIMAAVVLVIALVFVGFMAFKEEGAAKVKEGCDYYGDRVISNIPAKCISHFTEGASNAVRTEK